MSVESSNANFLLNLCFNKENIQSVRVTQTNSNFMAWLTKNGCYLFLQFIQCNLDISVIVLVAVVMMHKASVVVCFEVNHIQLLSYFYYIRSSSQFLFKCLCKISFDRLQSRYFY